MNQFYDKKAAVTSLIALSGERANMQDGMMALERMFDDEQDSSAYHAVEAPEGGWRLVQAGSTAQSAEETIVTFQGIIFRMDLPPFEQKISPSSKQIRYLRQTLTLTALDTTFYEKITDNIAAVHGVFGRSVGPKKLQPCTISSIVDDVLVIEMANRYFTPKKDAGSAASLELTKDIDPYGYLSMAARNDYIHTQENSVLYYKRVESKSDGHYDYIYMPPVSFQVGDIVEVQVSFSMYPLREGKFKTALVLRSILLLDGHHTNNASLLQSSTTFKKKDVRPMLLKRRVGYANSEESEQVSSTRTKFQRMEINEDNRKEKDTN